MVVGHGQGAAHAQRLLRERMTDEVREKLAVAYIIDHPMVARDVPLRVCEHEATTGCVAAWTTIMPGEVARAERLRQSALVHNGDRYVPVAGRDPVCVNPLSWQADTRPASKDLHLGGVGAVGFEPDVRPVVHSRQVEAQCLDGLLAVSQPAVASLRRPRKLNGGAFRTLPSNLFYEDLRVNAQARVAAKLAEGAND